MERPLDTYEDRRPEFDVESNGDHSEQLPRLFESLRSRSITPAIVEELERECQRLGHSPDPDPTPRQRQVSAFSFSRHAAVVEIASEKASSRRLSVSSIIRKAKRVVKSRSSSATSGSTDLSSENSYRTQTETSIDRTRRDMLTEIAINQSPNPLRRPPADLLDHSQARLRKSQAQSSRYAIAYGQNENQAVYPTSVVADARLTIDTFTVPPPESVRHNHPLTWVIFSVASEDQNMSQVFESADLDTAHHTKGCLTNLQLKWTIPWNYKVVSQVGVKDMESIDNYSSLIVALRLAPKSHSLDTKSPSIRSILTTALTRSSYSNHRVDRLAGDGDEANVETRLHIPPGKITAQVQYSHTVLRPSTRLVTTAECDIKTKPDGVLRTEKYGMGSFGPTSRTLKNGMQGDDQPDGFGHRSNKFTSNHDLESDIRIAKGIMAVLEKPEKTGWLRTDNSELSFPTFQPRDALDLIDDFMSVRDGRNLAPFFSSAMRELRDIYAKIENGQRIVGAPGTFVRAKGNRRGGLQRQPERLDRIFPIRRSHHMTRNNIIDLSERTARRRPTMEVSRDLAMRSSSTISNDQQPVEGLRDVTNQRPRTAATNTSCVSPLQNLSQKPSSSIRDINGKARATDEDEENIRPEPLFSPRRNQPRVGLTRPRPDGFPTDVPGKQGLGWDMPVRFPRDLAVQQEREVEQAEDLVREIDEAAAIWESMRVSRGRSVSSEEDEERLAGMGVVGPPFL